MEAALIPPTWASLFYPSPSEDESVVQLPQLILRAVVRCASLDSVQDDLQDIPEFLHQFSSSYRKLVAGCCARRGFGKCIQAPACKSDIPVEHTNLPSKSAQMRSILFLICTWYCITYYWDDTPHPHVNGTYVSHLILHLFGQRVQCHPLSPHGFLSCYSFDFRHGCNAITTPS